VHVPKEIQFKLLERSPDEGANAVVNHADPLKLPFGECLVPDRAKLEVFWVNMAMYWIVGHLAFSLGG
jgi:hypothetical protein